MAQSRVLFDNPCSLGSSGLHEFYVLQGLHRDVGDAPLAAAGELARAAEREVVLRELETILRGGERLHPLFGGGAEGLWEREAIRLVGRADHAAA